MILKLGYLEFKKKFKKNEAFLQVIQIVENDIKMVVYLSNASQMYS